MEVTTFTCSICGESSRDICVFCTKDACGNHLCDRCHKCSDCCGCDMPVFRQDAETRQFDGHLAPASLVEVPEAPLSLERQE